MSPPSISVPPPVAPPPPPAPPMFGANMQPKRPSQTPSQQFAGSVLGSLPAPGQTPQKTVLGA